MDAITKSDNVHSITSPLTQRLRNYMQETGTTAADIGRAIGYDRSRISKYLSGKIDGDPSNMEDKLRAYLDEHAPEVIALPQPQGSAAPVAPAERPVLFESRDAKNVLGVCRSCQEYVDLGLVVGRSGYGKTHTLKQYAKLPRVAYVVCDDAMGGRDLVRIIENALHLPRGYGSVSERADAIKEFFNVNKGYLLIIDEADKLITRNTLKKVGIIQAIFDQSTVGVILAGEPKLEFLLKTHLPRVSNRISFYAKLDGMTPSEVERYLAGPDVTEGALLELKARACNTQTGCFRLLARTLSNVDRLLRESGETTITKKTIEQASSMMML